jgi:superfamily II DNA or RNA helicase
VPQSSHAGATLSYTLKRQGKEIVFDRFAVLPSGKKERLTATITAITSGRVKGPPLSPTQEDLAIEMALGSDRYGVIPAKNWKRLLGTLRPLARQGLVTLDDKAVETSDEPVGLLAVIADDGVGIKLYVEQDPAIVEIFANGLAWCNPGVLRPVVLPQMDAGQRSLLKESRYFGPKEIPEFTAELLPRIKAMLKTDVRTAKLPGMTHATVGVEIEIAVQKNALGHPDVLKATPRLAYLRNMEAIAHVSGGRLIPTGSEVPRRDSEAERLERDRFVREFSLEVVADADFSWQEGQVVTRRGEAAVQLWTRLIRWEGRDKDEKRLLTGAAGRKDLEAFKIVGDLTPKISFQEHDMAMSFHIAGMADPVATTDGDGKGGADAFADVQAVFTAWKSGSTLVSLRGGGFAKLPLDWLSQYGPTIDSLLAAKALGAENHVLPRAMIPLVVDLAGKMNTQVSAGMQRFAAAVDGLQDIDTKKAVKACSLLKAELRDYQKSGVAWLAGLQSLGLGGVLADDMGLGKTVQTLAILQAPALVVAPTSVLPNWIKEIEKFRPDLKLQVYHGGGRELAQDKPAVVITTYALLRRDLAKLKKIKWTSLVLDEAQQIKNPESLVSQAAYDLPADFKLCLSGTPVENHLDDAWSLFHFSCPGLLGDRKHFAESLRRRIESGDAEATWELRRRIKPFLLRRLKRDVAIELPARSDMVLYAELSAEEKQRYEAIQATTRKDVMEQLGVGGTEEKSVNVFKALEALLRLRQAACHQALLPGIKAATSSKLDLLLGKLTELVEEGHKALVFSQWTSFLDLIGKALDDASLPYLRLDGSTTNRGAVVDAFQTGDKPILIMSLKAGGVGLNLTAADHVFIMDPWWNPASEEQAADRAHRIGQDKPVMVYKLVSTGTVEERILLLQERKKALAASVTEGGAILPASVTREDLLALLKE